MTDAIHIARYPGELPAPVEAEVQDLLEAALGARKPGLAARLAGYPARLVQVARLDGRAAGFKIGYQEKPGHFYSWLGGVHPDLRRRGVGRALMHDQHAWLREHGFRVVTMKTRNRFRDMLLLAITEGFQVTGVEQRGEGDALRIWLRLDLVSA